MTAGWVVTVVHLDTQVDLLMAGCLLWGWSGGKEVKWLVDTMASVSLLSRKEWERVEGLQSLQTMDMRVTCVDGRLILVAGTTEVDVDVRQCQMSAEVILTDIGHGGILGMDALHAWAATVDARQGRVNLDPPGLSEEGLRWRWRWRWWRHACGPLTLPVETPSVEVLEPGW